MTRTPWGNSERLRERKLAPGARATREEVAHSQRERLFGAMVAVCGERGYEATTVVELVAVSGVSRRDFYRHFADKEACFVTTLEAMLGEMTQVARSHYDGRGTAMRRLIGLICEQPAAARLCLVEAYAAGAEAIRRVDGALGELEKMYGRAVEARSGGAAMPPEACRAIIGGQRMVIYNRLLEGRAEELVELGPQLFEWGLGYEPPRRRLPQRRERPGAAGRYQPGDPAERIMAAVAETMAQRGYGRATIGEIVARAGVSLSTFYENFEGKEAALLATLQSGQARLVGVVRPAYRRGKDWPEAVRAGVEAMLAFFAAEPAFAQLVVSELYAAGKPALAQRNKGIAALGELLEPGFERSPQTPEVAREAIGGMLNELIYAQIRREGAEKLQRLAPLATYLTLAPFVGAAEACAVARGRR